jgi:hypothetical protein
VGSSTLSSLPRYIAGRWRLRATSVNCRIPYHGGDNASIRYLTRFKTIPTIRKRGYELREDTVCRLFDEATKANRVGFIQVCVWNSLRCSVLNTTRPSRLSRFLSTPYSRRTSLQLVSVETDYEYLHSASAPNDTILMSHASLESQSDTILSTIPPLVNLASPSA